MSRPISDEDLSLVHTIARNCKRALPQSVEYEELVADGNVGLVKSLRDFDPSRGVPFRAYSMQRIKGEILDGLRSRDVLSRYDRDNRPMDVSHVPIDEPAIQYQLTARDDVYQQVEQALLSDRLEEHVRELPARSQEVLRAYYWGDATFREIATSMDVCESRAVQIRNSAVKRLQAEMDS